MSLLILFICIIIICSFIFSLLESSILSISVAEIYKIKERDEKKGALIEQYKNNIDRPITAIVTVNTIINTVGSILVGTQAVLLYSDSPVAIATVSAVLTFSILFLGEIIPKTIASKNASAIMYWGVYPLKYLKIALYPAIFIITFFTALIKGSEYDVTKREEIRLFAKDGLNNGQLTLLEMNIISNLLSLHKKNIHDIFTPRMVVQTQNIDEKADVTDFKFTRVPVWKGNVDNIIGILHKQDCNEFNDGSVTFEPIVEVMYNDKVYDVFQNMLEHNLQMVVVRDDFNQFQGVLTLEDCLETILGIEIVDETDIHEDMRAYARTLNNGE